jgi:hypothetical protein
MKGKPQRGGPWRDRDVVRVVYDERRGLRGGVLLIALLVVSSALAAFLLFRRADPAAPTAASQPRQRIAVVRQPARVPVRPRGPDGVAGEVAVRTEENQHDTVDRRPKAHVAPTSPERERAGDINQERRFSLSAREHIASLRESGETAGLAAFPLPGTRPARPGVIVPPDYQLPEGFARHYQTTDDGRQLDPVLIVAPGYEIVDDAGEPVALTDNRIVPPEYAPPDLPVQMLDVPSEHDPGEDAR